VLFFGLFFQLPSPPPLEKANSAVFRYFLIIFGLFSVAKFSADALDDNTLIEITAKYE